MAARADLDHGSLRARLLPQRAVDVAIGVTLALSLIRGACDGRLRWGGDLVFVGLHALVALLFIARRPASRDPAFRPRLGELLVSASSVPMLMVLLALAPAISSWSTVPFTLLVVGGVGTLVSLGWLGRSFGVLPGLRTVVRGGPYRIVRHPAYACELLMVLAAALAGQTVMAGVVAMVTFVAVVWRIRIEERILSGTPPYGVYMAEVRFRLFPHLW